MGGSKVSEEAYWYCGTARGTKKNVEELQKHFTRLEYWSDNWKLRFDTDKCEMMRNSKKRHIIYVVTT